MEKKPEKDNYMTEGMALGMIAGTTFGIMFDQLTLGISIGMAIEKKKAD